jgi:GH25 family lysozyme M1 (1,4-beta-N-acetylmuramidase)
VADSRWSTIVYKTVQFTVPELGATLKTSASQTIPLANVQFDGAASGGTGIYYYRFSVVHNGVGTIVQPFGESNTCNWTATEAGTYSIVLSVADSRWTKIATKTTVVKVVPAEIKGIDVSHYQGDIDWEKVKNAGVKFAMIKAGGSDDGLYQDNYFEQNYTNAVENGLAVGAYYYGCAITENEAIAEAQHCLSILKNRSIGLYVAYDVETDRQAGAGKDQLTKSIIAFCDTIKKAGYKPMVYANVNFFTNFIDIAKLRTMGYDIWVAHYGVDAYDSIAFPARIWQSSSSGQIDGITKNTVDLDTLYFYDPNMKVAECTDNGVNIRTAAGTSASIVTKIYHCFFQVLGSQTAYSSDIETQELWYHIKLNDGTTGWISGRFVKLWNMTF